MPVEVVLGNSYNKPDGTMVTIGHAQPRASTSKVMVFSESASSTERWFFSGEPAGGRVDPANSLVSVVHPVIAAKVKAYDALQGGSNASVPASAALLAATARGVADELRRLAAKLAP